MTLRKCRSPIDANQLKQDVRWWATKIGVQPKRVQVQLMTKKWASCSPAGRIYLNADLLLEDAKFRDVVIVHELLHLQVPNHGKLFKSLMKAFLPQWEDIEQGRISSLCRYQ